MAGIAGILAGAFILAFAILADGHGLFLFNGVLEGASIEPWIQNVLANPSLSRFIMVLPALGFSCIFVVAIVLYQQIGESSWQKNLALVGYAIGVPVVVSTFLAHLSLMNEVLLLFGSSAATDAHIQTITAVRLHSFSLINHIFGPFFIIIVGTSMMAWAALKAKALPSWICVWLMTCGALLSISIVGFLVPALRLAALGAPLHMVGFVMLGVILLRRSVA
jgi:hypothetical protein